ncbi:MAG: heme lyase CcmF/NrfE family subunit [Gemmatimonadales bacterium]
MVTEIGSFALLLALLVSAYTTVVAVHGGRTRRLAFIRSAENGIVLIFSLLGVATAALVHAFVTRNFAIEYVASYSSRDLPLAYAVAALWGGQKGSLLLWALVLALFGSVVVVQNRWKNRELLPYVVGVVGALLLFFNVLLVFVTPAFERLPFTPADGQGLNPMLQNPGMIFHPTTLYLGYIGFTIPFAFAIAALITGRLGDQWIRTTRRWTVFSWFFLTWGNLFGAQWAYVELGWGGFWMWDPVESASLLPWLTGTAFLHSVMIQEKKNMLKVWNVFLIVITFGLTLFGTFLTRSGILSSVHTFSEATLGPMFLGLIAAVLILSFGLMAKRMHLLRSKNELDSVISRESSFLMNNLLFLGATFAVFWGTVFPLISEAVRGVKITVGAPFFNQVNTPIFLALLGLTGICPLIAWRRASAANLRRNLLRPALVGGLVGISLFAAGMRHVYALISFTISAFVIATIVSEFYRGARARRQITGKAWPEALIDLVSRNSRRYGGYVVHFGVVVFLIGVTGKAFVQETKALLSPGDTVRIGDYSVKYTGIEQYSDRNRVALAATLDVTRGGRSIARLTPQKRTYRTAEQPTTEVAIHSTLKEDLYVIFEGYDGDLASFKLIVNPLTAWLWIAGVIITVGTMIAMWPERIAPRLSAGGAVRPREKMKDAVPA